MGVMAERVVTSHQLDPFLSMRALSSCSALRRQTLQPLMAE
jgi:hypothetical protein